MAKNNTKRQFGSSDQDLQQDDFDAYVEELQGGQKTDNPRLKLQDGDNVLWILPRYGDMSHFIERVNLHYAPMHLCGRAPTRPDPRDPKKTISDPFFSNCVRCKTAWDVYDDAGRPATKQPMVKHPLKTRFVEDMPSDQALIQAIDLSYFFDCSSGDAVFNGDTKLLGQYLSAIQTGDEDEIAKLPEALQESAVCGVSVIIINSRLADDIDKAEKELKRAWGKRGNLSKEIKAAIQQGPSMHPDMFLSWITRSNDKEEFMSRGKSRTKKIYTVKYLTPDDLASTWGEIDGLLDDLLTTAFSGVIDLRNPLVDLEAEAEATGVELTVSDRARGFVKLSDEEILEYLEVEEHNFSRGTDVDGDDDGMSLDATYSDDDDFSDPGAVAPLPDLSDSLAGSAEEVERVKAAKARRARAKAE